MNQGSPAFRMLALCSVLSLSGPAVGSSQAATSTLGSGDGQVLAPIVQALKARGQAQLVVISRELVVDRDPTCGDTKRQYLVRMIPKLTGATLEAFCSAPAGYDFTEAEVIAAGHTSLPRDSSKAGQKELRVSFSRPAFDASRTQALVYVQHDLRGEYWLLELEPAGWVVHGSALSWIA